MKLFGHRDRHDDPLWTVASATPVFVADPATVDLLLQDRGAAEFGAAVDGVLVARRHPTGWFIHAVRRDSLPADQVLLFEELVVVRAYLLLAQGPQTPAWQPTGESGAWRSPAFAVTSELAAYDVLVEMEGPHTP